MTLRISLALQGGGAHGAFTWGVLDRLLDDEDIEIAAISGTSAGALNGAALKAGMVRGGREAARENLDWVWGQVAGISDLSLGTWFGAAPPPALVSKAIELSPAFAIGDALSRMISPYGYGPFYANPLERIVDRFEFDLVCADTPPAFFVCATNVRTGKIRVFSGDEIDTRAIMASACLPTMHQAVEIEDPRSGNLEAYWDGGYSGNPALHPMFRPDLPGDIVIVNINPLYRSEVPRSAQDIQNRINEISFNASLLSELRAIAYVQQLIDEGHLSADGSDGPPPQRRLRIHMIADDQLMNDLSVATKTVPTPYVISRLRDAGRRAAAMFLHRHRDDIGARGTVDLPSLLN